MYRGEYIVYDGGSGRGERAGARPFVYLVVQKVGCSSVKRAISPLFDLPVVRGGVLYADAGVRRAMDVHDAFNASVHQVPKAAYLEGVAAGRYDRHLRFAFVRDPFDRLLSCHAQKLAPGGQGLSRYDFGGVGLYMGMPFAEFARAVCRIPDTIADAHFRSQHLTTHDDDGRPLADTIGKFESLRGDFAAVAARVGLDASLPHMMRSGRAGGHYAHHYDAEARDLVAERYARDLELFGYAFRETREAGARGV